jgi:hypothetical protein
MKIYNISKIILFIFYQYLYIPDITFVISYGTHQIIKNNFISFTSGIYCLNHISQIITTLKNNHLIHYNYFFYGLAMIILYCSIFEIYVKTFSSGVNTLLDIIRVISNKIIKIAPVLHSSIFEQCVEILDQTLNSMILISDRVNRNIILDKLRFLSNKIIVRIIQIELQNNLQDNINQIVDQINVEQNIEIINRVVNGVNGVNGVNQSYEDFINELNIRYPLRCRGLENNDNDRIDAEQCNICLEELNFDQLYRTIDCSHSFHPHCIDRWLFQSRLCAICRTQINI